MIRSVGDADPRGDVDHHLVEIGREMVRFENDLDDCADTFAERDPRAPGERAVELGDERRARRVDHRCHQRRLVGKILIERPDAHPCAFGDARRGEAVVTPVEQKLNARLDDRVDGRPRARLLREFALFYIRLLLRHRPIRKRMENVIHSSHIGRARSRDAAG
jgi:hypothetical protein